MNIINTHVLNPVFSNLRVLLRRAVQFWIYEAWRLRHLWVVPGLLVASTAQAYYTFPQGALSTVNGVTSDYRTVGDGTIVVGDTVSNTRVDVINGGRLQEYEASVGRGANSDNNRVRVIGAGSEWISGGLNLGMAGSDNSVEVQNAGYLLLNGGLSAGGQTASTGNQLHVTGIGSSCYIVNGAFSIGDAGSYNLMRLDQGASATNHQWTAVSQTIGTQGSATYNRLEVVDPGTHWQNYGTLNIGYEGDYNALVISNGATMAMSANSGLGGAVIGASAGADHNEVIVTGSDSLWEFATLDNAAIKVGDSGDYNTLTLSNGGVARTKLAIYDLDLWMGLAAGSDHNQVIVSGVASALSGLEHTVVGGSGSSNTLRIFGGGTASTQSGDIGQNAGANNNQVIVDGVGSVWSTTRGLTVGSAGSGNSLQITGGGLVTSTNNSGYFVSGGLGEDGLGDNNTVLVDGDGSLWRNDGAVTLGRAGADNLLHISNGGSIEATQLWIGDNSSGFNNVLRLSAGSLTAPILNVYDQCRIEGDGVITGDITLESGGILSPGIGIGIITNIGDVEFSEGSVFEVEINGTTPGTDYDQLVVNGSVDLAGRKNSNTLTVSLGYAPAIGTEFMVVQNDGSDAVTGLFDGALEGSKVMTVGAISLEISYVGGTGNDVVLLVVPSGPISWIGGVTSDYHDTRSWSPSFVPRLQDDAYFSTSGSSRSIRWYDDAVVANAYFNFTGGDYVSMYIGSRTWNVTERYIVGQNPGTSSVVYHNSGTLAVTNATRTAELDVRRGGFYLNGGTVLADQLVVTNSAGGFNFTAGRLVTGGAVIDNGQGFRVGTSGSAPAVWEVFSNAAPTTIEGELFIGSGSTHAALNVTGGASLLVNGSNFSYVGDRTSSTDNEVLISGAGSTWENKGHLWNNSARNSLVVSNGGSIVVGKSFALGRDDLSGASRDNEMTVTGLNSSLRITNSLTLGYDSPENKLTISNGGLVTDESAVLGSQPGAFGNQATVTGAGSSWLHNQDVFIGSSASGNSLLIANGGTVGSPQGYVGYSSESSNNVVTVTGAGSVWSNAYLHCGYEGSDNTLRIADGGRVDIENDVNIGYLPGANRNQVVLDGSSSRLQSPRTLYTGSSGAFNSLIITNGAQALNQTGSIGRNDSASNNLVTVTGTGSRWVNSGSLYAGESGSDNTLRIENGGRVDNNYLGVGIFSGSSNNWVVVDGPQSLLANNGTTYIGQSGAFNTLEVSNGGQMVCSNTTYIGFSSDSNTLHISDGGYVEMNYGYVGSYLDGPSGNTLRLSGGSLSVLNNIGVKTNNTLAGFGNITGWVRIEEGGILAPGEPVGTLVLSQNPSLQGETQMDLSKSGGVLTQDVIDLASDWIYYNGSLTVTHLGPEALASGDSFQLFSAPGYYGSFDAIDLPTLSAGLSWINNLLVDGSIAVTASVHGVPTVGAVSFLRTAGEQFKVRTSQLLVNTSDPEGSAFAISSIDATSASNHVVSTSGAWLYYSPPNSFTNTDSFTFSVTNSFGGTSTGTVTLLIESSTNSAAYALNLVKLQADGANMIIGFSGIPGRTFDLEGTQSLSEPIVWTNLGSILFSTIGYAEFTETNAPSPRFYRLKEEESQ